MEFIEGLNLNGQLMMYALILMLAGMVVLLIAAILSYIDAIRSPWVHRVVGVIGTVMVVIGLILFVISLLVLAGIYQMEDLLPFLVE